MLAPALELRPWLIARHGTPTIIIPQKSNFVTGFCASRPTRLSAQRPVGFDEVGKTIFVVAYYVLPAQR